MKKFAWILCITVHILLLPLEGEDNQHNRLGLNYHGFLDYRWGRRLQEDPYQPDQSIHELRYQSQIDKDFDIGEIPFSFQTKFDLLYNRLDDNPGDIRLERGLGWLDLRELYVAFSPYDILDVKVGRQIVTWGLGDFIFINDLFPKDWVSFFIGRDDEYLKAPSDVIRLDFALERLNLNFVYAPRFDPDRFITGQYLSYYNSMLQRTAGQDYILEADIPNHWLREDEIALRAYRTLGNYEVAGYFYHGFWKSPGGFDPVQNKVLFPRLSVYGTSIQRVIIGGIGYIELGYYHSLDDRKGTDPFINNSEVRTLVGYRREIKKDLTLGFQYYTEWMQQYGAYHRNLPPGASEKDEWRHLLTLSLTQLLFQQNLRIFFFGYYSPSDEDFYFRFQTTYKWTDTFNTFIGINWFGGDDASTFFGQFEKNTNLYLGMRYLF